MFFSWRDDVEALHFTCATRPHPERAPHRIHVLLALITEDVAGHFDCGPTTAMFVTPPLRGTAGLMPEQLTTWSRVAISESDASTPPFISCGRQEPADALTPRFSDGRRSLTGKNVRRPLSKNIEKSFNVRIVSSGAGLKRRRAILRS